MNIYIACALTHVPRDIFESYANFIHKLASKLNAKTIKYALINSDPQLDQIPEDEKAKYCYLWDRKMVEESDLIIAESSFPSIGLGIELQIAEIKNIPIIIISNSAYSFKAKPIMYKNPNKTTHNLQIGKGYVSLMALGLPNLLKVIDYDNEEKCIIEINNVIQKIKSID